MTPVNLSDTKSRICFSIHSSLESCRLLMPNLKVISTVACSRPCLTRRTCHFACAGYWKLKIQFCLVRIIHLVKLSISFWNEIWISGLFISSNLEDLFKNLKAANSLIHTPKVSCDEVLPEFSKEIGKLILSINDSFVPKNNLWPFCIIGDSSFHDAGFDSFATGYCFVRTAHIAAANNL